MAREWRGCRALARRHDVVGAVEHFGRPRSERVERGAAADDEWNAALDRARHAAFVRRGLGTGLSAHRQCDIDDVVTKWAVLVTADRSAWERGRIRLMAA